MARLRGDSCGTDVCNCSFAAGARTSQKECAPTRRGRICNGGSTVKRLFYIIPAAVFAGLAFLLYIGLFQGPPSELPSPLVGKPAPGFALPALDAQAQEFSRSELGNGRPVIVNFWASWCTPCRIEHAALQQLAARK